MISPNTTLGFSSNCNLKNTYSSFLNLIFSVVTRALKYQEFRVNYSPDKKKKKRETLAGVFSHYIMLTRPSGSVLASSFRLKDDCEQNCTLIIIS